MLLPGIIAAQGGMISLIFRSDIKNLPSSTERLACLADLTTTAHVNRWL